MEFVMKPGRGKRFGPNCIPVGTVVPIKSGDEVVGYAEVVEVKPDEIVMKRLSEGGEPKDGVCRKDREN
jgi:hypothetical protein